MRRLVRYHPVTLTVQQEYIQPQFKHTYVELTKNCVVFAVTSQLETGLPVVQFFYILIQMSGTTQWMDGRNTTRTLQ
jgi:hypothetical protein